MRPERVAGWSMALILCGPACVIDELREDDVGTAPACEAALRWPRDYAEQEDLLLAALDQVRLRGGRCGDALQDPVPALTLSPELRCAARIHATTIARRGEATHVGLEDSTTQERVADAAYDGVPQAELLAVDFTRASDVLDAWLADPDHCRAIFDPTIADAAIGHAQTFEGDGAGWVLLTGLSRD